MPSPGYNGKILFRLFSRKAFSGFALISPDYAVSIFEKQFGEALTQRRCFSI